MRHLILSTLLLSLGLNLAAPVLAYPLDGYEQTGIRRLQWQLQAHESGRKKQPPGALLNTDQVDLRLRDRAQWRLPPVDPAFNHELKKLLGDKADRYGIAVLDLSDPQHPRYGEHRGDYRQNVGSVGKILVGLALFQALADAWPDDPAARTRILRDTVVTADDFIHYDHHKVRVVDAETGQARFRKLRVGDQASLWEFLDWMLSPSSNAAAAMVMKQAMLLKHFGQAYPVSQQEADRFFQETPYKERGLLYERTAFAPITRNGLDLKQIRQGSFFTKQGKRRVPGTSSYATARSLMQLSLAMEQGRLVDDWSSQQLKRLLYMTERRIRYASAPALRKAAVYFKSGSLYACRPEAGFQCHKYKGNKKNYMNSVAIVEDPAGTPRTYYLVALISNVLKKNSAVDHQTLATRIHRLIQRHHGIPRK